MRFEAILRPVGEKCYILIYYPSPVPDLLTTRIRYGGRGF